MGIWLLTCLDYEFYRVTLLLGQISYCIDTWIDCGVTSPRDGLKSIRSLTDEHLIMCNVFLYSRLIASSLKNTRWYCMRGSQQGGWAYPSVPSPHTVHCQTVYLETFLLWAFWCPTRILWHPIIPRTPVIFSHIQSCNQDSSTTPLFLPTYYSFVFMLIVSIFWMCGEYELLPWHHHPTSTPSLLILPLSRDMPSYYIKEVLFPWKHHLH